MEGEDFSFHNLKIKTQHSHREFKFEERKSGTRKFTNSPIIKETIVLENLDSKPKIY